MADHLPAFDGTEIAVGDRVLPVGWGDGVSLSNSNSPATVVGLGRTRLQVRFDGNAYGGHFPEFDAAPSRHFRRLSQEG